MDRAELMAVLRATLCAEEQDGFVFLRDPHETEAERAAFRARQSGVAKSASEVSAGWLCLPTGGTSGGAKLARHDERTLGAAVAGVCAHFGLARINAVDVLPPHHVSGLMARVRSAATGGECLPWGWKRLVAGDRPHLRAQREGWVISLVPTQLQRLVQEPPAVAWLRGFRVIFLGGGPVWPELAEAAARAALPVALSYGMTETAAMVAALRPEEFLAGDRTCGTTLPHARITIEADGVVKVSGESVFRGYWPAWRSERDYVTEDLGSFDARGRLQVLGRRDAVIITGGKKVQPAEVEAVLRATGEFADVAVIGVPDAEWGEVVVACYPTDGGRSRETSGALAALAPHQRPKRFCAIDPWPGNAPGKVNRAALRAMAVAVLASGRSQ
jgi:O-succinylbenzoic acid--CoA ligase